VTDDRHDEIAARLREEGAARAPERLRADVMLQVRAEPRPRRIRPRRRSYRRPLGSLAAAACIVAAATFGVTQLDSGASSGVSAPGPTREAIAPSAATPTRGDAAQSSGSASRSAPHKAPDGAGVEFQDETIYGPAPLPLRSAWVLRNSLAAPLRQAFAPLELRQGRGTHNP
jgi:negative regulator of sigma E activity